jgi:hypothetical protein
MESRAKRAGHAIHPMLVVFPLGLLAMAANFDLIYLVTGNAELPTFSSWAIATGAAGALRAALFGFWDWRHLPGGTRAKGVSGWHALGNVVVGVDAGANQARRGREPDNLRKDNTVTGGEERPPRKDRDSGRRTATIGRAVVPGIAHEARGEPSRETMALTALSDIVRGLV